MVAWPSLERGSGEAVSAQIRGDRDDADWTDALARVRERQSARRAERIRQLMEEALRSGQTADEAYWSLVYDLELAPITTNRAQLSELGVEVPDPATLSDAEVSQHLSRVIHALADLQTYLLNTDHLSDRELLERLVRTILDEPVREICQGSGGREFIDLAGGGKGAAVGSPRCVDRDRHLPRPLDG